MLYRGESKTGRPVVVDTEVVKVLEDDFIVSFIEVGSVAKYLDFVNSSKILYEYTPTY